MDPEICQWIMEFLLRQPISNQIIQNLLTDLPISLTPLQKKSFLLKSLHSSDFSDQTLQTLESIESLDKLQGNPVPVSMKKAYCAAAVECTVKELGERGRFMEVVERVWRTRIAGLEEKGSELLTEDLRKWRDEVEATVLDYGVRRRLFENREDAACLLEGYLEEAFPTLGEPFLQLVAKMERLQGASPSTVRTERGEERGPNNDSGRDIEVELPMNMEMEAKEREPEINSGREIEEENEGGRQSDCAGEADVTKKKKNGVRFKHVATGYKRSRGRVRIRYSEEDHTDIACTKYNTLPTPEVDKVQEALKTSSMELKALVKDPLHDVLQFAATLNVETDRQVLEQNISVGNQCEKVVREENTVVQKQDGNKAVEPCEAVEPTSVIPSSTDPSNVHKPSLMERNKTARTYEWGDDFGDGSADGSSDPRKFHLDTADRKLASPLKKYEPRLFTRRRRLKRWSLEEEDALRDGVLKFGKGNWKFILNYKRHIFSERTEVDLKDKWRNMTK